MRFIKNFVSPYWYPCNQQVAVKINALYESLFFFYFIVVYHTQSSKTVLFGWLNLPFKKQNNKNPLFNLKHSPCASICMTFFYVVCGRCIPNTIKYINCTEQCNIKFQSENYLYVKEVRDLWHHNRRTEINPQSRTENFFFF